MRPRRAPASMNHACPQRSLSPLLAGVPVSSIRRLMRVWVMLPRAWARLPPWRSLNPLTLVDSSRTTVA